MEGNYHIRDQDSGLWHHFFNYSDRLLRCKFNKMAETPREGWSFTPKELPGLLSSSHFSQRERGERKRLGCGDAGHLEFILFICVTTLHLIWACFQFWSRENQHIQPWFEFIFIHWFWHPVNKYTHACLCGAFFPSIHCTCTQPVPSYVCFLHL